MADPQSYEHLADHYEDLTAHGPDPVAPWLPTVLPARGGTALDLGCGAGRHTLQLADRFERVLAVDLSAAMIDLARTKRAAANVEYRAADLFDIDGQYDMVYSSAMLHHVADLQRALDHIATLVAPGGTAVLVDVMAAPNSAVRFITSLAPRAVYRLSALLHLLVDTVRRAPDRRARHRAATHRPWLDHMATDHFLTVDQFDTTYGATFPGASFVDLTFLRACVWTRQ